MITPQIEFAVVLKIDFKLKASPYTVTTRYFAQSNYEDTEIQHNGTYFKAYGLIRAINGLGSSAEDVIPTKRTGTIVLDNTRGSTGHNLRFHDWLDKEEIIAQPIEVRYYIGALGSDIDTDGNVEFVGKVLNWSVDPGNGTIRINVGCDYFDVSYPTFQITADLFVNPPTRTIGIYLPVIFGTAIVPCYALNQEAVTDFAYASHAVGSLSLSNTGVTTYYAKDGSGDWCEIISTAATTTKLFDNDIDGGESASPLSSNIQITSATQYGIKLAHSASTNYIVTSGFVYFYDNVGGTINGKFTFSIVECDPSGIPNKVVGKGYRDKSDFTWANDNSQDKIEFTFEKPVVLNPEKEYLLAWAHSDTGTAQKPVQGGSGGDEYWLQVNGEWRAYDAGIEGAAGDSRYALYGVLLTAYNPGVAGFTADQKTYASLEEPMLSDLNLIVKASGLKDDGSGTITGTIGLDLGLSAPYAIAALTTIGTPPIDPNTATVTTYPRRIDGATRGRVSIADICAGICRANACKVVSRRNGDLVIWSYGTAQTSQATISEDDCQLTSIDSPGTESIVNSIDVAYAETAIPLNIEDIQTGQPRSFEETLSYDYDTDASTAAWSTDSFNLYGTRELNTGFVQMPWIRDDASAAFMSKYYMTVYSKPRKTAELSIPFLGKGYDTLELLDLITLVHIDMPNEFGTSAEGVTPFPVEDGVVNTEVNSSYMWHEAQAYTCRIVERKVNFNIERDEMPTMDLKVQILDNPLEIR